MWSAPHHGPLYRTYAELEARHGNYESARALFRRGLAADPFHAQLFHAFAEMEGKLGNIAALKELDDMARALFSEDKGKREAQLSEKQRLRSHETGAQAGAQAEAQLQQGAALGASLDALGEELQLLAKGRRGADDTAHL